MLPHAVLLYPPPHRPTRAWTAARRETPDAHACVYSKTSAYAWSTLCARTVMLAMRTGSVGAAKPAT